jgi:molybdenum cofactor cytidylyltransferase
MICGIVLAAGRSLRMGGQKLLLPYGGKTMIGHVVGEVIGGGLGRTFVVTGADHEAVAAALSDCAVTLVRNPDPEGDMLSSVRCGVRAVPEGCEAVLVALGDQPGITANLAGALIREYRESRGGIVVPSYGGKRGHPLVFSRRYFDEVLTRFEGEGLRALLLAHAEAVREVRAGSAAVLADVDTPEDYRRAVEGLG